MIQICLPTDLTNSLQRNPQRLTTHEQLAYLLLILNRLISMTGVYMADEHECVKHLQASIGDYQSTLDVFNSLKSKQVIFHDQDVLFIPAIPEFTKMKIHSRRFAMNKAIHKYRFGREDNRALLRYFDWFALNVEGNKGEISGDADFANENRVGYDDYDQGYANYGGSPKPASDTPQTISAYPTNNSGEGTKNEKSYPTQKMSYPIPDRAYPTPKNGIGLSSPSSSPSLSMGKMPSSSGIDVGGGTGEIAPIDREANREKHYEIFDRVANAADDDDCFSTTDEERNS